MLNKQKRIAYLEKKSFSEGLSLSEKKEYEKLIQEQIQNKRYD